MSYRSWAGDSDSVVYFLNRASIVQRPEDGSLLCTELANLTKQAKDCWVQQGVVA